MERLVVVFFSLIAVFNVVSMVVIVGVLLDAL